jgi:hypothetical protein
LSRRDLFNIKVLDVAETTNQVPTDILLTLPNGTRYVNGYVPRATLNIAGAGPATITENVTGAVIGMLEVEDESTDVHSFSLSGPRTEWFEVDISHQLKLKDGVFVEIGEIIRPSFTDPFQRGIVTGRAFDSGLIPLLVTATDSGGLSRSKTFYVSLDGVDGYTTDFNFVDVNGPPPDLMDTSKVNKAPTDIILSWTHVDENQSGAHVGYLSVIDPDDVKDSHSVSVSGSDADFFEVVTLRAKSMINVISDGPVVSTKKQDIVYQTTAQEVVPLGGIGGTDLVTGPALDVVDLPVVVHSTTYALKLKDTVSLDYETKSSYSVGVTATDPSGLSYSETFTINVQDVKYEAAPTDIKLTLPDGSLYQNIASIKENSKGAIVGKLSVADPDKNDSHSLALSGLDNSSQFEIVNNQLKLKSGFSADYETKSSYSVGVTATDLGGLSRSEEFVVKVTDDLSEAFIIDDVVNLQQGLYAAQKGNDVYVLSPLLVKANAEITIIDIQDTNKLQLIGGLTIESALLASKTLQLTLSNKAVVTVLDAERFIYETGGDPVVTGTAGVSYSTFNDFTSSVFGKSVPSDDSTIVQTGGAVIQADGSVTDVALVGIPSIGADEILGL